MDMFATSPPPGKPLGKILDALVDEGVADGVRLRQALDASGTALAAVSSQHTPSQDERDEARALSRLGKSPWLPTLAVASELWTQIHVPRCVPYSTSGTIVASSVELRGLRNDVKVALSPRSAEQLATDAQAVSTQPAKEHRFLAEGPWPELLFLLACKTVRRRVVAGRLKAADYGWTCLLLDTVAQVVSLPVQRLKHMLQGPRPAELTNVDPVIPCPAYSSFPGGHATLCAALAVVMANVLRNPALGGAGGVFGDLAATISKNRELAGLHTAFDTQQGAILGRAMGQWMIDAAGRGAAHNFATWAAVVSMAKSEFQP